MEVSKKEGKKASLVSPQLASELRRAWNCLVMMSMRCVFEPTRGDINLVLYIQVSVLVHAASRRQLPRILECISTLCFQCTRYPHECTTLRLVLQSIKHKLLKCRITLHVWCGSICWSRVSYWVPGPNHPQHRTGRRIRYRMKQSTYCTQDSSDERGSLHVAPAPVRIR